MKHFVLTRSAFGPAWDRAANARRLTVTRAVTAKLMVAQTCVDWTWIVLLDERDPFLHERLSLYANHTPAFIPIIWTPPGETVRYGAARLRQRVAAADYKAPWRQDIPSDETVLMTRLDDDDGLAPDGIARYQQAAKGIAKRTALVIPDGVRVWRSRYSVVRHERNAMHTLVTPPGDTLCVYDYNHTKLRDALGEEHVELLEGPPGWLWVRHTDTISGWRKADHQITGEIRQQFPVDWAALIAAWR